MAYLQNDANLLKRLAEEKLLSEEQLEELPPILKREEDSTIAYLVKNELVPATVLARSQSKAYGSPLFAVDAMNPEMFPEDVLKPELVEKLQVLPLYVRGSRLFIATSDPSRFDVFDDIKFASGMRIDVITVEHPALVEALGLFLKGSAGETTTGMDDLDDDELDDIETVETEVNDDVGAEGASETPIVRFVNKMLFDAIKMGSSDLHFEPYEKAYRVRFRTDGVLHEVARPPIATAGRISARLKVLSQMDISERRKPQDGRIKLKVSKTKAIDFRVNTLPTLWGEKIVLRILDPTSAQMGIDALGYEDDQKQLFMDALSQPQGMILVTGPTGSGKTVSLYTGLNILNTEERNISTAEDPVEINLEGINQVNVNAKVGLTFSTALRSFLRQDPDIVMVGEIRDLETAEIAIKAAQTGHLVLSTLHTNSAPETLTRLANMGVPSFNIATSVNLIIAQRLARRLCKTCKIPADDIPEEVLQKEGILDCGFNPDDMELFHPNPKGCGGCTRGYKGRVGIYEVVRITPTISRIIMEEGNAIQIADAAAEAGFNNLRTSALRKVCMGVTSLEEANRVTND
ncbi:MAG: type IV-A pilus assembly ATPase PilB [Pseudomonadales bacterium]|jgi:type IV pilus assembly protein PilB